MTSVPLPTPIYHITCISNLASILRNGGLQCYRTLQSSNAEYTNIAYGDIQSRRANTNVRCGPGGTLHDYVPFYFAPRSPMLYTINSGNVPGYVEGQGQIIHLVSTIQTVEAAEILSVFTDGHAIVFPSQFFDSLSQLDQVSWDVMQQQSWHDNDPKYPDRKRKRQAEFLVYQFLPWHLVTEIGVISFQRKLQAEALLQEGVHKPLVTTHKDWYY